jgi:hypothetical protein
VVEGKNQVKPWVKKYLGISLYISIGITIAICLDSPWRLQTGVVASTTNLVIIQNKKGELTSNIQIANNTGHVINLSKVGGCGCTQLEFDAKVLVPLQVATCTVTVDPETTVFGVRKVLPIAVNKDSTTLNVKYIMYKGKQ